MSSSLPLVAESSATAQPTVCRSCGHPIADHSTTVLCRPFNIHEHMARTLGEA